MMHFLSSLAFLYACSICILIIYAIAWYRSFAFNRSPRKGFPVVFASIMILCTGFLYINMNPGRTLNTYSNLDHHFIRHDGYQVNGSLELGTVDTSGSNDRPFNRFIFSSAPAGVTVQSPYAEEPFYINDGSGYKLASAAFPATGEISFRTDSLQVKIGPANGNDIVLRVNGSTYTVSKDIQKGSGVWSLFRGNEPFINAAFYTDENLVAVLKQVLVVRQKQDDAKSPLCFFLSGKLARTVKDLAYQGKILNANDLALTVKLPVKSGITWGLGLSESNRRQYTVTRGNGDSFSVMNRFPQTYPLTEEANNGDGTLRARDHDVTKFLVSSSAGIAAVPAVFREGFLFTSATGDSTLDFSPLLLSYTKQPGNRPLNTKVFSGSREIPVTGNRFLVPSATAPVAWQFSINDTRNWQLGSSRLDPAMWQLIIFGVLLFFSILVLGTWFFQPGEKPGWIWQVLSCVTVLLLTTRLFLYWRYKTFPPFEGMDLPSLQQLNSPWNFAVIIIAITALGLVMGSGALRALRAFVSRKIGNERTIRPFTFKMPAIATGKWQSRSRMVFFLGWTALLAGGGAVAAVTGFDPSVSRHLAIVLILFYFLFLFISYKHSPLVKAAGDSWWSLGTGSRMELLVSNPVKVLLSVSLLGLFALVDIGFAILFLNFLLFNEAFLCINYSIAGLSAGSTKNSRIFGIAGAVYMLLFIFNLTYGPYVFRMLLDLPAVLYTGSYLLFATGIAYTVVRILPGLPKRKRQFAGLGLMLVIFAAAYLFFPKERILAKAAMTRYRIDVMTMPVSQAIEGAYEDGKNYTPVIRAAQNQWFINTFIDAENNPAVNQPGFNLLQHAPQHKGARYNAQATDLVASRFLIAEHGKLSVLFYVLLLMLPAVLVASFYKLYPDFTNRVNNHYPVTNVAFALLNYLLVAALLVILAATGRYIFFGQDLPFGSILSKQSILFPALVIIGALVLFRRIKPDQYPDRRKIIPGLAVLSVLVVMLFFYKPAFNRNKTFGAGEVAKEMDTYIQSELQPLVDYFAGQGRKGKSNVAVTDRLFTDSLRKLLASGHTAGAGKFLQRELEAYSHAGFSAHLDQNRMLYLDLNSGTAKLAVNDNFFRIDPPPHLQQYWSGNVYSDTGNYNITSWNAEEGKVKSGRITENEPGTVIIDAGLRIGAKKGPGDKYQPVLINTSGSPVEIIVSNKVLSMRPGDSIAVSNPSRILVTANGTQAGRIIQLEPDAFMKNYFVNGSRFYVYPLQERFIWARNFAENVASNYTSDQLREQNAYVSLDAMLMDSLSLSIKGMMTGDSSYGNRSSYGICIADGEGRLVAMADHIKGLYRPDPNDKAGFSRVIHGEQGLVSQSLLRQQIGNINMLRMNPGPGSTLKPVIFAAIASQLDLDWNAFAAEGFSTRQQYFGGEKVADYDFEKNNGRVSTVRDYLRLSDNYYHANLLLLGSYSRQDMQGMLSKYFETRQPGSAFHWPWFQYKGKNYWLNGFENWPGFANGRANFGSDSSFVSMGLVNNFGIYTDRVGSSHDGFNSGEDSVFFRGAARRSGFLMPEYALFDQKAAGMHHDKPNELFLAAYRGHVKGSSQVMIPPVKMVEAFGKLVNQDRNYAITLDPYVKTTARAPFITSEQVSHQHYLELIRESVFGGMKDALFRGTAAALGAKLKNGSPYYYYAKTGTTGDDKLKEKSKLFVIIISQKDIAAPGYNFRDNKFYTIYFTSQDGPAKQNEQFQAKVIRMIEQSPAFKKYMAGQ